MIMGVIKLLWKSIKNEIDAETYKAAIANASDDNPQQKAELQSGLEKLDENYCRRKVDEAIMFLQRELSPYIAPIERNEVSSRNELSDKLHTDVESWSVKLRERNVYIELSDETLAAMLHRYVVCYVLAEWYSKSLFNLSTNYNTIKAVTLSSVYRSLMGTPRKIKRETFKEQNETTVEYV